MELDGLTSQQRKQNVAETFASWAIEGMYPSESNLAYARAYINGEMSLEEIRRSILEKFGAR